MRTKYVKETFFYKKFVMATNTQPQTAIKSGLIIRKIGKLTKQLVHHIGNTITP